MCVYVCVCVHVYVCMYVCMCMCVYVCMYVCMYVCRCMCMCICVCVCMCMCDHCANEEYVHEKLDFGSAIIVCTGVCTDGYNKEGLEASLHVWVDIEGHDNSPSAQRLSRALSTQHTILAPTTQYTA